MKLDRIVNEILEAMDYRFPGDDTENVGQFSDHELSGKRSIETNREKLRDKIRDVGGETEDALRDELRSARERVETAEKKLKERRENLKRVKTELVARRKKTRQTLKKGGFGKEFSKRNVPDDTTMIAGQVSANIKTPEFNKKLKSIISTALDLNLLKIQPEAYGETIGIELYAEPNMNQKDMWKILNNKRFRDETKTRKMRELIPVDKLANFIKGVFPVEDLTRGYDLEANLGHQLVITRNKIKFNVNINTKE